MTIIIKPNTPVLYNKLANYVPSIGVGLKIINYTTVHVRMPTVVH